MHPIRLNHRLVSLGAAIAIAITFVTLCLAGSYPVFEDAFISFRYATQFSSGNGLVFNPGERVWGYSNLLWTIWLGVLTEIGVDTILAARLSGVALGIAVLMVLFRSLVLANDGRLGPSVLCSLLLATNLHFVIAASNGMETMSFTLLTLTAVVSLTKCVEQRSRVPQYAFWALLASLARPEGPMLLVAALGWEALRFLSSRDRIHLERAGVALLGFAVVWGGLVFAMAHYYGSPLPNPYYVKVDHSAASLANGARYVFDFLLDRNATANAHAVFLSVIAAFCLVDPRRSVQNFALVLFISVQLAFVIYVGGDFPLYCYRFLVPTVPLALVLLVNGASRIQELLNVYLEPRLPGAARSTAVLLAAALLATNLLFARSPLVPYFQPGADRSTLLLDHLKEAVRHPDRFASRAADWLSGDNPSIQPMGMVGRALRDRISDGEVVATCQCGQIPYYLDGVAFVDMCGLMDDHVAHRGVSVEYLVERDVEHLILYQNRTRHLHFPDTIFPGLFHSTLFRSRYELKHVYCHETQLPSRGLVMKSRMLLFSRRSPPVRAAKRFDLEKAIRKRINAGDVTLLRNTLDGPDRGQHVDPSTRALDFCGT